jgi:hypothetical protein
MWRNLLSLLRKMDELSSLLREQNSLLREVVLAHGRQPRTPLAPSSTPLPRRDVRKTTQDDIWTPQRQREEGARQAGINTPGPAL